MCDRGATVESSELALALALGNLEAGLNVEDTDGVLSQSGRFPRLAMGASVHFRSQA